ncbi:response regulator [Sphingomonas sp. AAP5]|jgi:two-component system KDP operon response regulator KdpE|uniref:response regulator n=1 Tax=unclassified Sphingomonas TaxID=196159 RepID=UPI00105716E7|nr:response regulator [Sphingomonas sp. AAP5]QBM77530.1 response regulator [Sphingomonas sp. AAP5]
MTGQILIVDDEAAIRRLVRGAIERGGLSAEEAANAAEALTCARRPGCELVLLDLGLPDRDGIELIPHLKALERTVIVLTARDAITEKVAALDLGADDYVVKPFDTDELLARVRVALRRHTVSAVGQNRLRAGPVEIDLAAHQVWRDGAPVKLTRKEFALLAELARHAGKLLTHTHLLRRVWGDGHVEDVAYLRVAIRALRLKLEADPAAPSFLLNEPGIGYRLIA